MTAFFQAHSFLIGQMFGFCAIFVGIIMYQFKKHRTIMLLMVLNAALWCLHFLCLGKYTAVAMNLLNVVRAILFSFRGRKWADSILIPIGICVASLGVSFFTWEGPLTLLPVGAALFSTSASCQTNTKRLKLLTVPVCVCWFIYNLFSRSYAGMANETFVFVSVVVALVRIFREEKHPAATPYYFGN